jgi:hypothetical protein
MVRKAWLRWSFAAFLIVAVLVAAASIYQRALPFPFCRDDGIHFLMRERWARPPARLIDHFREDFWGGLQGSGLYRPLTAVTIQATAWWTGLDPAPLRAGNLLLHALVALTAAALARRGGVTRTGSALLALLLVAHPLFSEDVLEVVSRSALQATLGTLAAAALLAGARVGVGAALGAAAFFLFGLLSKEETTAALPALLLLLIAPRAGPGARPADRMTRAVASLLLVTALEAVLLVRARVLGGYAGLDAAGVPQLDNALIEEPFVVRLLTGVANLGRYVGLVAVPADLSPDYSFAAIAPLRRIRDTHFAVGALALLLGGVWLATALRRGRRIEAFGLLLAGSSWFLISSIAFPIGTIFAERLFHLPACGLLFSTVAALDRIASTRLRPVTRRIVVLAGALAIVALGVRSYVRAGDWRDPLTLFTRALEVVPDSARVHCAIGYLLRQEHRDTEARPRIERALEIVPIYRQALSEEGMLDLELARVHREAVSLAKSYVWFWLADHAVGASPLERNNFQQVAEVVRRAGLPRSEISLAARTIADARRGLPLYEQMRRALAPDGR